MADAISCVVYLYAQLKLAVSPLPKRMPQLVNQAKVLDWMDRLKPVLNTRATSSDPYGVVFHPK
jgi:hypothetical protein